MRYKIDLFEIYGLKIQYIFLNGWADKSVKKLIVKDGKEVCLEYEFDQTTKLNAHYFRLKLPFSMKGQFGKFSAYFEDCNQNMELIGTCHVSPFSKINKRLEQKSEDKYLKEAKNYNGYDNYIHNVETFSPVEEYEYNPLISIIIPVYNVSRKYLSLCLDSILNQTYQNFEICLADDCSPSEETRETLRDYEKKDSRIKVVYREKNGHISNASNSALSLATGEFIAMMDNDDELMPQALNEIVRVLNKDKTLDFIYTDEDKEDLEGVRSDPQYKPDLAIEKLYGGNYICHFNVIRKSIMDKLGGFRVGYEGAQDFDLFLRVLNETDKFYHIPKVLYHWRMIPGSTALSLDSKNYAGEAGKRALVDYFETKNINAQVDIPLGTNYIVTYIPEKLDINVIIYVNNISTIFKYTRDLLDIHSDKNIQFTFVGYGIQNRIDQMFKNENIQYTCIDKQASKACLFNEAAKNSSCQYLAFLCQDVVPTTYDCLSMMQGYCENEGFGVIGGLVVNNQKVMESGYILVQNNLLQNAIIKENVHTQLKDFGNYSNHLVTNNFRIMEDKFYVISKRVFDLVDGFDETLHEDVIHFDLMLKVDAKKYRSAVDPRIHMDTNSITDTNYVLPIKEWKDKGIDTEYDRFYNENLSETIAFKYR